MGSRVAESRGHVTVVQNLVERGGARFGETWEGLFSKRGRGKPEKEVTGRGFLGAKGVGQYKTGDGPRGGSP